MLKKWLAFFIGVLSLAGYSASVNHIYRGNTTISGTSTTVTLCDSVDLSSSILLFNITNDNNVVGGNLVGGELSDEVTITFRRDGSNGTATISYQIVEFSSGVAVQRGSTSVNSSTTNQAITAVGSLTNSFPIVTMRNNGSTHGSDDGVVAELTTTTNLQFRCQSASFTAYWQVVEYDSCSVQTFSSSFSGASSTSTLSTSVTTTKTMLFGSHYQSGNVNADDLPRTELTNSTTVTFTRVGSASTITFFGYAVEFTDNTTVQHGSFSFGSGNTSDSETITSVNTLGSVVYGTGAWGHQGSTPHNSDDNIGYNWAYMSLDNATTITAVRAASGSTAEIPFQVATFHYNQTSPKDGIADKTDPTGPFDNCFLNNIHRGQITMGAGSQTASATLPSAVDVDSSFLVFSVRCNSNEIGQVSIGGELTNSTTVTFYRASTGTAAIIDWQVFYFASGVWVQHGSTNLNSTTVNQAITAVNLDKSFVLSSFENTGTSLGPDDGVIADLSSTTNIQFRSTTLVDDFAYWQVVQYDDALVRKSQFSLLTGQTSTTYPVSGIPPGCESSTNGVSVGNTYIVSYHTISEDINSDDLPRIQLTDTNEITATRIGSSGSMDILSYVVEFFDSSTVTHGNATISGTATSTTVALTVDTFNTCYIGGSNMGRQGSSTFNTDDNLGYNYVTYNITSPTLLTVTRGGSSSATTVAPYQIIEWDNFSNPPLPVELAYFSAKRNGDVVNLNWATWSEINNESFLLERQSAGEEIFESVAKIPGSGTTNEFSEYEFEDEQVQQEDLYYRLTQFDFNGKKRTYPLVFVPFDWQNDTPPARVYPNPARAEIFVLWMEESEFRLSVQNNTGLTVYEKFGTGNEQETIRIPTQRWEPGVYFLRIQGSKSFTQKVIIQP